METKYYSYQACLVYASTLPVKDYTTKDLIALCTDSTVEFWRDFKVAKLSQADYNLICLNINKHLVGGEPVAYLRKRCFFHKLPLRIEQGVFIPQPDTEVLVESCIALISEKWGASNDVQILEIGSGSGNIALSLATASSAWQILAVDINKHALATARLSAADLALTNVKFLHSNLFTNVKQTFNVIISNPPYLSLTEYEKLGTQTRKQPFEALVAANNGLQFYQQIISESKSFLKSKFLVIFEIGYNQENEIIKMLLSYFCKVEVKIFKDLSQKNRVLAFYN